ncbi:MAG TPA: SDR family NAD(P)-dependent oxidoreductase [Syntrophobacteraceae bacterium]|nr:SDR family NAD(P)-dependent oxidoreductase [Syntrophobacteraceae bacterium]
MLEIKDSVAVVTGGGGGIGLALAKYWVGNGGMVLVADVSEPLLSSAETQLKEMNGDFRTILCDVTSEDDCSRVADFAIEQFGRINLVAPFAGIIADALMVSADKPTGKVTRKMTLRQFQSVIDINLTGVFLTVRECAERMINNNCKGLICLISSTGSHGTAGQINYSSSKAAMSVFPKVLTAEFFRRGLADKIRCVAVAPGYVGTPMVRQMPQAVLNQIIEQVPIGRLIEPEEVVSLIGELYRNESVAGDVYYIHGGLRLGSRG